MDIELLTTSLILGLCGIFIYYIIRSKDNAVHFIVTVLAMIPLTLISVRKIELAVPVLIMIVVWEIRSLRKDSE
ncbi:hypothetical protein [Staphylococcus gallinarum]|uniref:Uncharacterized protein n=1 Tax=Staphylococcus gallinarum TaxID=1293 RepID=A0A2T4STY6_STAGA|nr:hypothetical protein [Staphylococcus gallinarum]MCD8786691.1 hypothetical protein [Staphylococcus gallinarum]MCD8859264.1 hypothetical protein [Staphylococcus gallinarum]PTL07659.1 hypothetical protein BUZ15_14065 [Staphylococcus gallinarum]RIL27532.1 hypothetical protein BUY98_14370 [Staphylococcus gallinarum]RIL41101.1 hypothetical protein BUZ01_13595 [Staphylococcus gallinarum]